MQKGNTKMTDESRFIERNRNIINKYYQLFGGHFMYHVPDGRLFYENKDDAYFIPENETIESLKNILIEDISKGINSIPERYKDHIIIYDPDKVY
jgi:hypothetical protein